jgi:predicted transcriptional regulator YdeE
MSYTVHQANGFVVLGISVRASNETASRIGDLWHNFHAMGGVQSIKERLNDSVYSVYCEYESDYTGEFTVVIGCAIPAGAAVPEGMRTIEIAAGRFAVIPITGELPQGVFDAWAEVWKTPLARLYQADFDRYGADGVTVNVGLLDEG